MKKFISTFATVIIGLMIGGSFALLQYSDNLQVTHTILNFMDPIVRIGMILALIYAIKLIFPKKQKIRRRAK